MKEFLWRVFAWVVSRQPVADYLIGRATRTPYFDLPGYMKRDWLWNRHDDGTTGTDEAVNKSGRESDPRSERMREFPSVRIHHILRADLDRNKHDHPFDFRTIILRNHYLEKRAPLGAPADSGEVFLRRRGDTATLNFGEFHNIVHVPPQGTWTMILCFEYKGTWGFDKDGVKIPWRKYLGYE